MKRTWGIIACILIISGCHTSKRPVLYSLNEHTTVNVDALRKKHPDQESVYLEYKRDISHDLKPDVTNNKPRWYFFESYHWKEVVLKETGSDEGSVVLRLGPEQKVRHFQARVINAEQAASLYKRKHLRRKRLSADSTAFELALGTLSPGTSVEVTYEIETKKLLKAPPLSHDVPLQLDRPVEHLEFAYTYPKHWEVQMKQVAPSKYINVVESADNTAETQTFRYSSEDVPAFIPEFYGPYFKQIAPYFHVKVNYLEVGNELEWSGRNSWDRVAAKYADLTKANKKTRKIANKRLQKLGIGPDTPDSERLSLIQQHVESELVIVSNPGKQSIWKSSKGNPLDAAAYMAVLLEEADIKTSFLLAHTAAEGHFDDSFITDEQFYAPVLIAEVGEHKTYLFPDKKGVPIGYIPIEYASQVALFFEDELFEGFVTVPGAPAYAYRDDAHYKLSVQEDGSVQVEASLHLSHHTRYRLNQAYLNGSEHEHSLIQDLLAHHAEHIEGLNYRVLPSEKGSLNRLNATYELVDCFDSAHEKMTVRSCGLFEPVNTYWYPFHMSRNTVPVLPADIRVTNYVQIMYPPSWEVSSLVQNVAEKGERVVFERTYAQKTGQLDINQHVILQRQTARSVANPSLAQSFQLPLGTSLNGINLVASPQIAFAEWPVEKGGPWTVIVETFESYDAAVDKALELEASSSIDSLPIRILSDGPVQNKYHVLLGNFNSRKDVETTRIVLSKELPFHSWIALVNPQMTAVLNSTEPITY